MRQVCGSQLHCCGSYFRLNKKSFLVYIIVYNRLYIGWVRATLERANEAIAEAGERAHICPSAWSTHLPASLRSAGPCRSFWHWLGSAKYLYLIGIWYIIFGTRYRYLALHSQCQKLLQGPAERSEAGRCANQVERPYASPLSYTPIGVLYSLRGRSYPPCI